MEKVSPKKFPLLV